MAASAATGETHVVSGVIWIAFISGVVILMLLDFLLGRKFRKMTVRKAAKQTGLWFGLGAVVGLLMFFAYGSQVGTEYYAAWLLEYSLSLDNVFAWALILTQFGVQSQYQYRVIFWGIVGALVMRFVFIFLGVALIENFSWMTLILGIILIWSAVNLWRARGIESDLSKSRTYRLFTKLIPTAPGQHGGKFVVRLRGKWMLTSLALCVLVVGAFDVLFAIDSVPAALGVSQSLFIVFAANAMALLGLRSLFFLIVVWRDKFGRLDQGLVIILIFVGLNLIVATELFGWHGFHLPIWSKLSFIVIVVTLSILASLKWPPKTAALKQLQTGCYNA